MAELLHDAGVNVVTLDDPFHWRYATTVNRRILPGNFPEDARRLAAFMRTVIDDLANDGLVDSPEVSIVGWSMGGVFTAYLAELESRGEIGFSVDAMLSVNPPVDSEHVLSAIDSFLRPSRSWTREQALEKFLDVAPRVLVWDELQFDTTPDISEEDAGYTAAAMLVSTIPELVGYVECSKPSVSIGEYFGRHVRDRGRQGDSAASARHVGLKPLENVLRGNSRLKMIHTRDDFLLDAADRDYLDDALGDRITWFSAGAHCGMFYTCEFREEVLERLNCNTRSRP
jgi:pimeloyl-ACP methyl ester carboxylesterase